MFKQRHSTASPSFVPHTPKLPPLALPDASSADMPRPRTPAMPPSSSRAHPTAGQPAKPLRSILKGGRNHSHDSYESDSDILASKKAAASRYTVPNVLPAGARLVPMKPPAFNLHWQLLPYDQRRSRRLLRFDMAFPVDEIAFQDTSCRTKLTHAELSKPAADGTMTKMLITFKHGRFSWDIDVKNARGICCRDVFEEIYKTFNEQLTIEEQRHVTDRHAVERAFRLRCKLALVPDAELSLGWKRVDVLMHQTIFLGLTQPKSGSDWVLNLGALPRVPGLS